MIEMSSEISEYCSSEHFLFLDDSLKPHAEAILQFWAQNTASVITQSSIMESLNKIARLDIPLPVRKAVPQLLGEFFDFISTSGRRPQAKPWSQYVADVKEKYLACFRDDGAVRGETFRKRYTDVGRNDPCPCGSGQKFKKCCMKLIS